MALAISILVIYKLQTADFSQVMSLATAKQLPEFYAEGRNTFFLDNSWLFWLAAPRSGFFPREWQYVLLCSFGLCLPWLTRYPRRFPLVRKIKPQIVIIRQILLVSLGLFALSHLLLFQLHLPSRYSQHTWRIIIALVDGITLAILLNSITKNITRYQKLLKPLIIAIAIGALLYPTYAVQSYPYRLGYVTGAAPELYQFLKQQPKDILIASLSKEADFIPSLAQRSVLVAEEYSIPYHLDYYQQIRRRTQDLITAQYSLNQAKVNQFIQKYNIDLWLLDKNAFQVEYLLHNPWLRQFKPETENAILTFKQVKKPILAAKVPECKIWQTTELVALDAKCMLKN